ncbi:MAG: M48 family metallopeptidase [Reichenbachiella sp.]
MKSPLLFLLAFVVFICSTIESLASTEIMGVDSTKIISASAVSFDPYVATNEYLDTMTPEQKAKSDAYFEGGYWLLLWGVIYSLFVGWIFLNKRLSITIKNLSFRITQNTNLGNAFYIVFYTVSAFILGFPMSVYEDYFREHQYDLSNLSFGGWLTEEFQGLLVTSIIFSLLGVVLYMAIRKTGKIWWLWGSGITTFFLLLIILLMPIYITPIFNDYKYLDEGPIKDSILSMAKANDVPVDNVYQFDASKQSNRISANVSGLANTIRISLNDNLLKRCNESEVKAVMGHELGHYVLNHVPKAILSFGLVIICGFAFVNWGFKKCMIKWGDKWGITGVDDVAGLPLIMVLFSVFFFFTEPVTNNIIRINEVEADNYGLNAAREPDGFASTAMKLSEYRKINPGYWEEIIFFDHPSGRNRVLMAMKWKAENLDR